MSLLRVLCVWLLMLALPLQGLAAASMLYCGGKTDARHQHHHDAAASDSSSIDAHAQATSGHDDHVAADGAGHKCAMCAFCGHGVALNQVPKALEFGQPAYASPPEPSVLIPAIAALVPDKPPRV
jgi:hypothetical protein